ncbi:hypothetical protein ACFOGG_17170 [Brenneria rubrifaciens]|uniref:hypothetical protein n=1 Tax=Brenneria rubrifaciens TaxID=55213 RepID=UPI003608FC24
MRCFPLRKYARRKTVIWDKWHGSDETLVLPASSTVEQSSFNFQEHYDRIRYTFTRYRTPARHHENPARSGKRLSVGS